MKINYHSNTKHLLIIILSRVKIRTGNCKNDWNWLSKSCSRLWGKLRLCQRWRLSWHRELQHFRRWVSWTVSSRLSSPLVSCYTKSALSVGLVTLWFFSQLVQKVLLLAFCFLFISLNTLQFTFFFPFKKEILLFGTWGGFLLHDENVSELVFCCFLLKFSQ